MDKLKVDLDRVSDAKRYEEHCRKLRSSGSLTKILKCPVCDNSERKEAAIIFDFTYFQCSKCTHIYVSEVLDEKLVNDTYSSNIWDVTAKMLYANEKTYKYRVEKVATPKVEFVEKYAKKGKWLDIGCGTGEVLYCAREKGWQVKGLDINQLSIDFAKEHFNLDIENKFLEQLPNKEISEYDVFSMFCVLPHVPDPKKILKHIHQNSKKDCFLVLEGPNFESFSTYSQKYFHSNVNRHLVPFSHISLFTFQSLQKLLEISGFKIVANWFFGQDFYEFLQNISASDPGLKSSDAYKFLIENCNDFQVVIDKQKRSDLMITIAKKI